MDANEISLRIIGKNGDEPLSPDNFDIGQIRILLDEVGNLLYPDKKKRKERSVISYQMKEGSVINVFFYGTADVECKKVYDIIKAAEGSLTFGLIDITIPYNTFFGELKFEY